MPHKIIDIDRVGRVKFTKRQNSKGIKIRIVGSDVFVSLPSWAPYSIAIRYLNKRIDWINKHKKERSQYRSGLIIGKNHKLIIKESESSRFYSKITNDKIIIKLASGQSNVDRDVIKKIESVLIKSLLNQTEEYVIKRTRDLAEQFKYSVNTISVKNLKSRWGSCSNKNDLTFSLYLIQLPWECVDYVIIHELAHTKYMNHKTEFWNEVSMFIPTYKKIRQQMKSYSPSILVL
jgi:predicted metal-dependent hydrolase